MERKFDETFSTMMMERSRLQQVQRAYDQEMKKAQFVAIQNAKLQHRVKELEKQQAQNDVERKSLLIEMEKNAIRNSSLQLASLEQQKADVNVMKLAEDQKRQKEELHNRIIQLEKKLDAKQAVELEIERLRGTFSVTKHMGDDGDVEVLEKVDALLKQLREKEGELEDLEALNQTLRG
uniref:Uncharacterized protein n=1 Tax=Fagus sylvatica TaxID=28930 RepID=A0A2N9HBG9_FAGSY